jgi:hypothetical protein
MRPLIEYPRSAHLPDGDEQLISVEESDNYLGLGPGRETNFPLTAPVAEQATQMA